MVVNLASTGSDVSYPFLQDVIVWLTLDFAGPLLHRQRRRPKCPRLARGEEERRETEAQ